MSEEIKIEDFQKAFEQMVKDLPEKREAMILIPDISGYKVYTVSVESAKVALTYHNLTSHP